MRTGLRWVFAYASSDGLVLNPFRILFLFSTCFGDDFRGVKYIKEGNLRRGLKGIEPGSTPRKNETLPTVLVGPPRLKGQPTSQYTIGSAHAAASRARVGLRMLGCGDLGSIGQPMGDYGLGYIGIDRNVRTWCQRVGRPTTAGHDRGRYSPGNVSSDARESIVGVHTTRIQK